jgi:hypothetical protein
MEEYCKHGMISDWCHYCLEFKPTCGAEAILSGKHSTFDPNTVDLIIKEVNRGRNMPKWEHEV